MAVPFRNAKTLAVLQLWLSNNYKLPASLWLAFFVTLTGHSQSIGNWNFNNNVNGTGQPFNTASTASFGPGVPSTAFNGGAEFFGENGWPVGGLNTNAYLQFSVTPNTSYELNLTNVILRIRRSNTGSPAGAGPTQWTLRSSLDGFSADIASGSITHTYANYTVALTGFHHLYTTVTFRLYGFGVTVSTGGISRLVVDNISIDGLATVLPVVFGSMQAQQAAGNTAIQWQADNIQAGTRFNLQRSVNGIDYTTIHSIDCAVDKATGIFTYTDLFQPAAPQKMYYRIEAIEPSGVHRISPVMLVNSKATASGISYLSLSGQTLQVALHVIKDDRYTITVHTASGMLMQQRSIYLQTGTHTIAMPVPVLSQGIYIITLYAGKRLDSKKIMH